VTGWRPAGGWPWTAPGRARRRAGYQGVLRGAVRRAQDPLVVVGAAMRRALGCAAGRTAPGRPVAVREWVMELRRQIVTHRRFKRLVDQWIGLSVGHSRLTMRIAEPKASW
jgi:hypothetical protein